MSTEQPSPVPADQDPWPGELPFTAFGQFGEDALDLRVFDQATWWVDRAGRAHRVDEMSREYRENVVTHLLTHQDAYHAGSVQRSLVQQLGDTLLGRVNVDALAEALGAPGVHELTPQEWLEATPLMRRLRSSLR